MSGDGQDKSGIGPAAVNGHSEDVDNTKQATDAPRPSLAAMLASVATMVEKPTEENMARRNAEDAERQRAIIVHSPHVLMEFEKDAIRQMGRDPENFVGMILVGQMQAQRVPTGQHVLALIITIPPGFFPALDGPAVMDANGVARSTKFDKQLAMPIIARAVIAKDGLGDLHNMRANADLLVAHEGKTFGELLDAGYVPPPGQAVPG